VTSRAVGKLSLLGLAWPIFVEQALRILITTVDTFMVSYVSDDAVAALGVATQVVVLCLILFNFIGIGSSVVITHHIGAGDRSGADRVAKAAMGLNSWIGLGVSASVAVFAGPLLGFLQLPPPLIPYAQPFLTLMGGTLFLEAQNIAMAAALRAHGHPRHVMMVTACQNLVNAGCNAVVLFGLFGMPRLGVPGVALSGIVSRLLCFVALHGLVRRATGIRLGWQDYFRFRRDMVSRILRIGLPAAGENANFWLGMMTVTSFASQLGEAQLAAFVYSRQILVWVYVFTLSIGLGTELLVGHLIGSGEFERAFRTVLRSVRTGMLLALAISGSVALGGAYIIRRFTADSTIIAAATVLLHLGVLSELGRVLNVVVINGLRATGDARFPLLVGALAVWCVWIPLAWLLGVRSELGLAGIWAAMICDEWLRGLIMYVRWKRRRWVEYAVRSRAQVDGA
jgi:putative MATE family efflux protein